ncbi:MAG TPA: serine/threonine-protein kinase, partial [Aggregatilineales bacterium]|nr:serine/threonine-protein kinase [Aggregatilineales bacterium]
MNTDEHTHQVTLLRPGDRIDEFHILSVLGNGGFSVVYKGVDTELERLVAIKQFNPSAFSEPTSEARFLREAKLAASLNHSNIVSIYTFKRQPESLFLIMEFLAGGSIRDLLTTYGYLAQGTFIKLATHVCQALDVLHGRGVIHRDIKPENILCTEAGDFKLADFGLAHMLKVDRRRSAVGPQSGTLLYMSPEQAAGEPVTPLSDIYSFATVLYECLTGQYYLHEQDTEDGIIQSIIADEPIAPSAYNPNVPDTFDAPLLKALSKDPARRYRAAGEFLEALKAAAARHPHDPLSPELVNELYTIRTLRDLLNEPEQAQARLNTPWVRDSEA